jgi:dTDP-4-amino-4,6-dideoxygalactose transaminase
MVQIVKEHGLIPVPVDLNLETLQPISVDAIKSKITPKTKAMIFAHLYGLVYNMDPYLDELEAHNIDIIEDCAQSFKGA